MDTEMFTEQSPSTISWIVENNENSIEIPYHLYQFLSTGQCNINVLCRICLKPGCKVMFPLYTNEDICVFGSMFTALTTIEIVPGDGLPINICRTCSVLVESSYKFKVQCERANNILKAVLKGFTKVNSTDGNYTCETIPIITNANDEVKQELDIFLTEEPEFLQSKNSETEIFSKIRRTKKIKSFLPHINDQGKDIRTEEESRATNMSNVEDIEYLDDENDEIYLQPRKVKHKRKKNGVKVTDSKKHFRKITSDKNESIKKSRKSTPCKYCTKTFCTAKLLRIHLTNSHSNEIEFLCDHCNDTFHSEHDLQLHSILHTEGPTWKCGKCEKLFNSKVVLRRHLKRHMKTKQFSCETCGKMFTEMYALRRHSGVHTGETREKKYHCHLCDKKYLTSGQLAGHIASHEGHRPCVCTVCGKSFLNQRLLTSHSLIHSDTKQYACAYCDKRFRHESSRNTHHRTHTGEKPYVCSTCGKTFIQTSNLTLHMRTHTGEKPYACSMCDRKFSSGSSLKTHERTHTGEKPYECKICGKKYARATMKAHMRMHTGERPYPCAVCPKKFVNAARLREHSRIHTGEKPFECAACSKKFQSKYHLLKHVKTHTGKKKSRSILRNPQLVVSNEIEITDKNVGKECETDSNTLVFDIQEVPIEVGGELVLEDANVKTEMLLIEGQDYQTNINSNVILGDVNYGNSLVAVNDTEGNVETPRAELDGASVKLYQLDQSLLQIHSSGGHLTIRKITSKMTANF